MRNQFAPHQVRRLSNSTFVLRALNYLSALTVASLQSTVIIRQTDRTAITRLTDFLAHRLGYPFFTTLGLAAILLTFPPALLCALFETTYCIDHQLSDDEMWGSGEREFAAFKLGKLKAHLSDGGTLWVGTTSTGPCTDLFANHGPGCRGGLLEMDTSRQSCQLGKAMGNS